MKNGGLDRIRSKVRPSTVANPSPVRHSTFSMPFRFALNEAQAVALAFKAVATTFWLCDAAVRARIPFPVPRSSVAAEGRRTENRESSLLVGLGHSTRSEFVLLVC